MTGKTNKQKTALHLLSLAACLFLMIAIAFDKAGEQMPADFQKSAVESSENTTLTKLSADEFVVNTTAIAKKIAGYAGPVPLKVYFRNGKVEKVEALENQESSDFFNAVVLGHLLEKWNGKTPEEALKTEVDGISGATYSSRAVIGNMHAALKYAAQHMGSNSANLSAPSAIKADPAVIAAILTALAASILPLFIRSKKYRFIQQILNICVLGFWSGSFLCYNSMLSSLQRWNGIYTALLIMLAFTAFIYPFFGKKSYYCTNICPLGALQEIAGKLNKKKWRISLRVTKVLVYFRRILWILLVFLLWSGAFTAWIDYELFIAFNPQIASIGIIIAAAFVIILSLFVSRPYCRFVCPTGTLFKIAEGHW